MRLSAAERQLLAAIAAGRFLKAHRTLDGRKTYRLHTAQGDSEPVVAEVVARLSELGLMGSNQKFPVATYWLTESGRAQLATGGSEKTKGDSP
ncbi:MAG: hypothetical protein ACRDHL_02445 [Candidatus Promineifilaceae bacterium]